MEKDFTKGTIVKVLLNSGHEVSGRVIDDTPYVLSLEGYNIFKDKIVAWSNLS
jgi:hypothetical protein